MVQSQLVVADNTALTIKEQDELASLENRMEQAMSIATAASITLATCLQQIHNNRLYKTYGTFDDYCRERWRKGRQWGYQLIEAAQVLNTLTAAENVSHGVQSLPDSERQIRPLTRLEPADQPAAWRRAIETAPNGKVTAAHVEQTVREWRHDDQKVFTDPQADEYETLLEERADRPAVIQTRVNAGLFTSATPEWYTPQHIIEQVIKVFGQIDLDPCSNSSDPDVANVPALKYWTIDDNGLAQPWHGNVYMNPPYGDEIPGWVGRLIGAYETKEIVQAIALLPARTDTAWFQPLYNYALCFVKGRLKFSGAENSAPFPSVVVYLGPDTDLFKDAFGGIGACGKLR